MSKSIAFLAGLGTGYFNSQAKKKDDERRDKRDARDEEIYQEGRTDRQSARDRTARDDADRDAARSAAAPVDVTPMQGPATEEATASRDPLAQNQPAIGYIAGARAPNSRGFAEQGIAEDYAKTQGTPEARRGRMSDLASQGNAFAAQSLTQDMQREAAQLSINASKQVVADKAVRRQIEQFKSHDDVAKFMSDSPVDNHNGALKVMAVKSPDGSYTEYMAMLPGGSMKPMVGLKFTNDAAGLEDARTKLAGYLTPEQRQQQYQFQKQQELQAAENKRIAKKDDANLGINQQNANTSKQNADTSRMNAESLEQSRKDQAANMKAQRALEAERIKAIQAGQAEVGGRIDVSLKDIREFESDFAGRLKDLHPIKDGANDAERSAMSEKYNSLIANGVAIFRESAMLGIPLTTGTVIEGQRMYEANKASQKAGKPKEFATGTVMGKDGKPRVFVMVGDAMVIMSGPMQEKSAAPAQATVTPAANSVTSTPAQAAAAAPVYPQAPVPTNPASATALGRFSPTTASGFAAAQFK
mgnify:CR=1 FL=1